MAAESNEKMMLNWFEKMTMKNLQIQQKTGILKKIPQLQAVENAISHSFKRISGAKEVSLSFDLDTHRIMMEYTEKKVYEKYTKERTLIPYCGITISWLEKELGIV